jgi:TonB family protein
MEGEATMRARVLMLVLTGGLFPLTSVAQVPRDTPPPSIQNARRERDLRALVASGNATRDTFLELANLEFAQSRFEDATAALHGGANLDANLPEIQHMFATIAWQHANAETDQAGRLAVIREGIALEDRALRLKPDYTEAMTYKAILLRLKANLTTDAAEKAGLIADADSLRNRVMDITRQEALQNAPASFSGFAEPYQESLARLNPVRVGGPIAQPPKVHNVNPTYPVQAQTDHVSGVVIVEALIDPSGSVANARILRSIPLLDEAALSAVSRWQFAPTVWNGKPVAVLMTVTVNFTLQEGR